MLLPKKMTKINKSDKDSRLCRYEENAPLSNSHNKINKKWKVGSIYAFSKASGQ